MDTFLVTCMRIEAKAEGFFSVTSASCCIGFDMNIIRPVVPGYNSFQNSPLEVIFLHISFGGRSCFRGWLILCSGVERELSEGAESGAKHTSAGIDRLKVTTDRPALLGAWASVLGRPAGDDSTMQEPRPRNISTQSRPSNPAPEVFLLSW